MTNYVEDEEANYTQHQDRRWNPDDRDQNHQPTPLHVAIAGSIYPNPDDHRKT
eukprot:CAMPEP_0177372116 /NCGR_PEP_ID=MMETSP0368-20130122/42880_1 /TAXON_ID=447022 ORGANISM="Scrippsiella hangoei-like, Strain SHHI-4" /NCGR_SAMPLE_ID=MMETSP0368 /ASSEMBLY_ACC=CAM_ASM_000363 /LENGTH=52 /DNA_ID=CAMNT_0018835479 /DNA_START=136 /DNA_END=295 /DNA_ORIENTATION=+